MFTFRGKKPTGLLLCCVILVAQTALADLTPSTLTVTLQPGESVSELKTATLTGVIPECDIVFALDLSSSMSDEIAAAKAEAINIMNSLDALIDDSKFGVMSYMDYPHEYDHCGYSATYGSVAHGDYAYNLDLALSSDHTLVSNTINSLILGHGWDGPQDYTRILYESYADGSIGYRPGAKKILLNFGDGVPHDCDINEGVPGTTTTFSRGGDPGRDEIMGTSDDLDLQTVLADMAANSITLLEVHSDSYYATYWDYWTGLTGGDMYVLGSSTDIPAAVYSLILAQATEISLLTLEVEAGWESWLTSVSPTQYTDLTAPTSVDFDIQITVPDCTPPGVYTFAIYAIGDGAVLGEQEVIITVVDYSNPTANCPEDIIVYDPEQCGAYVTYEATVTDNCPGATISCTPPSGSFFPIGVTTVTCTAVDNVGNQDICTFTVTVIDDESPVPACPATVNVQCLADVPEPDVGLVTATDNCDPNPVITHQSDISDGQSCPETITRTYRATDASSNWAECTQLIIVNDTINPICTVPQNSYFLQCAPTQVCLPVSCTDNCDPEPTMTVISGPGTIIDGTWCYTPTADGVHTVTVRCTDDCGNTCEDSFDVEFDINFPPVITCPPNAVIHWGEMYQDTATFIDPDLGQPVTYSLGTGAPVNMIIHPTSGVINWPTTGADVCDHTIKIIVTDDCGDKDSCEYNICVQNDPPEIFCSPDTVKIWWGYPAIGTAAASDPDNGPLPKTFSMVSFSGPGTVSVDPATGDWVWVTEETYDYVGDFELCIEVTDSAAVCPGCSPRNADTCCAIINVRPRPQIVIEKAHEILQGHFTDISITIEDSDIMMGGFEFLIAYDASALGFIEATPGQLLEDCDWEYFTYRYGVDGNCGNACPSGLLRIIALANQADGPSYPSCYGPPDYDPHELAEIKFYVNNDRTFECQYVPIYFFWDDCNDNAVSSVDGEILYLDLKIYDFEWDLTWNEDDDDEFPESARIPWVGAPDYCLEGDKAEPYRLIDFRNGGVDIICSDSIDARSDINANGIPNEIADAVMLTNYFINGLGAFLDHVEASIAASDVNADGITLSVADLVYLIRVIVGDAVPYAKPDPYTQTASVGMQVNHSAVGISINSPVEIGAGFFVFEHEGYEIGEPHLINGASDMSLKYSDENGVLKVLVYSFEKGVSVPAGRESVFAFPIKGEGAIKLVETQMADYWGNLLQVKVESGPVLPSAFALHQNYPNPFNATTTIVYELPEDGHVRIDIYNVLGQKIITLFNDQESAGVHSVEWRGVDESGRTVSSGIYLYRLQTAGFTADKKMALMK